MSSLLSILHWSAATMIKRIWLATFVDYSENHLRILYKHACLEVSNSIPKTVHQHYPSNHATMGKVTRASSTPKPITPLTNLGASPAIMAIAPADIIGGMAA